MRHGPVADKAAGGWKSKTKRDRVRDRVRVRVLSHLGEGLIRLQVGARAIHKAAGTV